MFGFLKRKEKEPKPRSSYAIQSDENIAYEIAKDYIIDIRGILSRYTYWLKQIGKDQSEAEKAHIAWVDARHGELTEEMQNLRHEGIINETKNNKIIDVYGKLGNEYHELPGDDRDVAIAGLPEKFVTTKVDYSEFETLEKGAEHGSL